MQMEPYILKKQDLFRRLLKCFRNIPSIFVVNLKVYI